MKGIIAGVVAGIVGAALWAIIAAVTGFEIGWLAWGIGAAVGAGVAWGSEGSPVTGVLAVIIAVLAILAGKYITVEVVMANEVETANEIISQMVENEEFIVSKLAYGIAYQLEKEGQTISWPAGINLETASTKESFPSEIWEAAEVTWSEKSVEEKEEIKAVIEEEISTNIQEMADSEKSKGFFASFGVIDIVFFLLAVATAYKVGSKADA